MKDIYNVDGFKDIVNILDNNKEQLYIVED